MKIIIEQIHVLRICYSSKELPPKLPILVRHVPQNPYCKNGITKLFGRFSYKISYPKNVFVNKFFLKCLILITYGQFIVVINPLRGKDAVQCFTLANPR